MKIRFLLLVYVCFFALVFASCKKDNYKSPATMLTGAIVYKGDTLNFKRTTNGSEYNVRFELRQYGWGKTGPIVVPISPDGKFSVELFNGDYTLVFPVNNVPFMLHEAVAINNDTMPVSLGGSKVMNIEVLPYYMIRNTGFSISKTDTTVTGSCKLEQILTDVNAKDVEKVYLYVSRTSFVDDADLLAVTALDRSSIADLNNVNLSVKVPSDFITRYNNVVKNQNYIFARIGLKISGVDNMMFSKVSKLDF